ncbi:transposase family Tnp2 protein, partial [Rhizoctonia solani AG-3 Rhs1AP]
MGFCKVSQSAGQRAAKIRQFLHPELPPLRQRGRSRSPAPSRSNSPPPDSLRSNNHDVQMSSPIPPPPVSETQHDRHRRNRRWHPDDEFDTHGAGPSRREEDEDPHADIRRLARAELRRFAAERDDNEPLLSTLANTVPWLKGLTDEQILDYELEHEIAESGGRSLDAADKSSARALNFKLETEMTEGAFDKLAWAFPELAHLESYFKTCGRIAKLSGVKPVRIDRCVNSCMAYTGVRRPLTRCPHCGEKRYEPDPRHPNRQRARAHFQYIPIIPRLRNLYYNLKMARKMRYRARRTSEEGVYADIFDGQYYLRLLKKLVKVGDTFLGHTFFQDSTDIALGLSTDGYSPFDDNKQSCWPIILFNYNLPPTIRFQLEHIMCVGVIPGPNQPADLNSYLEPLIDELEELARGVPAFDTAQKRVFALRAYLIAVFGDMPAIAKLMEMAGHNGKVPCRACEICGTRPIIHGRVDPKVRRNYIPLKRPYALQGKPKLYDSQNLPRRTHASFFRYGAAAVEANNNTRASESVLISGIKSVTPLARLSSIELPTSFPHDFMHAMLENVIPTLTSLWTRTGRFSSYGTGREKYLLGEELFNCIGDICVANGNFIPAAFGCRVPNLAKPARRVTAEMRLLFATMFAPIVLHNRFERPVYYRHFMSLVRLISLCLQLRITSNDLEEIRGGFAKWVRDYEKLYYEHKASRLRACTVPIHSLLHVADDIQQMGPVWGYWAFPMERFCGALARTKISPRFPWESLDERMLQLAQVSQLKHLYDLSDELNLEPRRRHAASGTRYNEYDNLVFVFPRSEDRLPEAVRNCIGKYLEAVLEVPWQEVSNRLSRKTVVRWGKMQEVPESGPGDTFRGYSMCNDNRKSKRNASYVKSLYPDETPPPALFLHPHALALVSPIPHFYTVGHNFIRYKLNNGKLQRPEVVDASAILKLVGRVHDRGLWHIVDRTTIVGELDMMESVADRS